MWMAYIKKLPLIKTQEKQLDQSNFLTFILISSTKRVHQMSAASQYVAGTMGLLSRWALQNLLASGAITSVISLI